MGRRPEVVGDEGPQVIRIVGCIHDDMLRVRQPFDQAAGLRAVTPLAGCYDGSDRKAKRVYRGVDLRRQAAFGAANTGSFKPPF